MDIATLLGIISACGVILIAIFLGGELSQFINVPSILIVVGGAFATTLVRFNLSGIIGAFVSGGTVAFVQKSISARELIEQITELADIARKNGPLGLEKVEPEDPALAKGVQYVADGYELDFIRDSLERERDLLLTRLSEGRRVFKSLADSAPAFGMIGTLVGLVQMLATMSDPSTIGPSMAVALLTTLYGAVIANVLCIPIYEKLEAKFELEELNQTLVIDGVVQIRESKSPNLIREMLLAYLPDSQRSDLEQAA